MAQGAEDKSKKPDAGGGGGGGGGALGGHGDPVLSVEPGKDGCSTPPFTKLSNGACYKQKGKPGGRRGPLSGRAENSDAGLFRSSRLRLLTF
jgi:hypothetical protein